MLPGGSAYPLEFDAKDKRDARRQAREFLGVTRLPPGAEVWEFTPESQRIVRESRQEMAAEYAKAGQILD